MAREYDPFKTYRPHLEYCPKCTAADQRLNPLSLGVIFYEPIKCQCWRCGNTLRYLNINTYEKYVIMNATDCDVEELERMAALKETDPTAFRNQIKEWAVLPKVKRFLDLNWHIFIKRCDWCIEHNIVDSEYKNYFRFNNYHLSAPNLIEKCPNCGKMLTVIDIPKDEFVELSRCLAKDDLSSLNEMLKLRDEDINKYYWKLGTMQAKRLDIRYPDDPISIGDLILRIPVAIIMLLKIIFFTWPQSFWAWLIVLGILIAWGGGS